MQDKIPLSEFRLKQVFPEKSRPPEKAKVEPRKENQEPKKAAPRSSKSKKRR